MTKYIDKVNSFRREYYEILSKDFPDFLDDYINTPEVQKLAGVSQICGSYWRRENIYDDINRYTVLDHSVGVALILWNFTHDKKQAIAGLLHDISSPAFKHCLDFMHGDAEKQESLEDDIVSTIENSQELMALLKRDNITLEEVADYKIYPIADNDTPRLSADRLEYTFMNGIFLRKVYDLATIKEMYEDLCVMGAEDGSPELGFRTIECAEEFIKGAKELWPVWISPEDIVTIYFVADLLKEMMDKKYVSLKDLYDLSEKEVIDIIRNCEDTGISNKFAKFMNCNSFLESDFWILDKFCVSRKAKKRYINPLTTEGRLYDVSEISKKYIDGFLNTKISDFAYVDTDI